MNSQTAASPGAQVCREFVAVTLYRYLELPLHGPEESPTWLREAVLELLTARGPAGLRYHVVKGVGSKGEVLGNLREPWGVLGKIREPRALLAYLITS